MNRQTIVGGADTFRQFRSEISMRRFVCQVREERTLGADVLRRLHGLGNGKVRGMRAAQQRVEHQHPNAHQGGACFFAKALGVEAKSLSYVAFAGGGPQTAALLGNQVACGIAGFGEFAEQAKAGKLRIVGMSGDKRIEGSDVPTFKESGLDVVLYNWRGVFGAPGITADQQTALIALLDKMVKGPTWQAELKKKDWTDIYQSGAEFGKYVDSEITRITAILKDLGLAT